MDHKISLRLLILLLVFSFVFSRDLKPINFKEEDSAASVLQEFDQQGFTRRLLEGEESSFIEGRMDFERADYSGTGANTHHDPKPPGSV